MSRRKKTQKEILRFTFCAFCAFSRPIRKICHSFFCHYFPVASSGATTLCPLSLHPIRIDHRDYRRLVAEAKRRRKSLADLFRLDYLRPARPAANPGELRSPAGGLGQPRPAPCDSL